MYQVLYLPTAAPTRLSPTHSVIAEPNHSYILHLLRNRHHGTARKLHTRVHPDQVRYHTHPVELQHVPFRPALFHL